MHVFGDAQRAQASVHQIDCAWSASAQVPITPQRHMIVNFQRSVNGSV